MMERLRSSFRRRRDARAERLAQEAQQVEETREIRDENVMQTWQARAGQPKLPKRDR
jgi:hypothetical protein